MKNRKRESCTSGTVRDEDGNILIYSARDDGLLSIDSAVKATTGATMTRMFSIGLRLPGSRWNRR
jgi:hypothetical protein